MMERPHWRLPQAFLSQPLSGLLCDVIHRL
jgi:hypothetical protein